MANEAPESTLIIDLGCVGDDFILVVLKEITHKSQYRRI